MRLKRVRSILQPLAIAAALFSGLPASPASADIVSDVSGAIGSLTVGGIVQQIQGAGDHLITEGSQNGSMLEFQAGNQMNILLANSNDLLTNHANTAFRNLTYNEQLALATAWQASQQAQSAAYVNAWLLQNVTVVDVSGLEDHLPLATQHPVYVQAVAGTVMVQGGSYQLVVVGSHMGVTDNTDRTTYSLKIDGKNIPVVASSLRRNVEKLSLDAVDVDALFAARSAVFKDAVLTIHNDHLYPSVWFNKGGWGHTDLAVPLKLALYALNAGTVSVTYTRPTYGFVDIGWAFSTGYMPETKDCHDHPNPPCTLSSSWGTGGGGTTNPTVGDVIYTNWTVNQCTSQHNTCGFSMGSSCSIQNNETRLNCTELSTSYPVQLDFAARESQYKITGTANTVVTQDVFYGQPFVLTVPADTSRIELSGRISIGGTDGSFDIVSPLWGSIFETPIASIPNTVITYTWPTKRPDSDFNLANVVGH